ncbi:serine-rich adhesin for platelets [Bactrocera dorsalis]|uniref:Serine-rich adhesin for platelets n=1 Tax=Bactrocera dorsalis TaxID=27457 RepID=A0ABM3JV76_BACDO|nr:serine-rich adhesin for platelets [Bactrocera dorsalis]XP_049313132.1 serine-rich adhesin for platelets [Bactrocera dorsalis]XP_049313133.1 serine-rich adhesin for platelets [Bactrocera dorsalis]XP_049313135.1 serine-rich adhesin for platelets [Bactrocera dorsalis]XP_049313136.1 serine-rich adhesin for platelets [Bactrocera dorsalis]
MMPLQSSGIIVVEKPTTAVTTQSGSGATSGVVAATTNLATQQSQPQFYQTKQTTTTAKSATTTIGKYYEYYGANDVRQPQQQQQQQKQLQHNVAGSNSNSSSRSQTQLPLMRRAVQRSSSSSNNIINKCNNNTITTTATTGGATNTKIKHINVKQQQQQQQQQPQTIQMNQQQHQLIQHTTIQQQQQQQIHQQQSQQLATQLQSSQPKQQQQHVQKQHQLSQQMHTQQQKSQQQTQPQQQQQVIQVSEEFIEQAAASGATNMMISTTTGEVLNPQIFKIVTTDGTTGNMIIDGGSATAVGGGGQSKVLLSNLTVLAKPSPNTPGTTATSALSVGATGGLPTQQQQHTISVSSGGQAQQAQTINYMSTKNLSYLTTAAAAATPITTGGGKTPKYTVTGTYKTGVKQQQQQLNSTTYIQQPQQSTGQNASQGAQQTQQLYQKLSVPRHVQMVTRVVQQPTAASTSMTTNTGQQQQSQQQQQQHTQMLVQPVVGAQKYLSSSATTKSVSVAGSGGNMLKKTNSLKVTHGNSKVLNNLQMQQTPGVKTTYITQQQQQQYQLHQPQYQSGAKVKTSKLLKQYNNVINNNSNASSGVNMLQQQSLGTYTISNSGGGHKLQPTTTKVTKMAGGKYATHQTQLQHVTTLPQGTHLHHKTLPQQQQTQQHQFSTGNNNVVTLATGAGNSGSGSVANNSNNTIKFVNSTHATVIQQHQTQTLPIQQQQQQTKVTLRQHAQQQQLQFVEAPTTTNIVKDNNSNNTIYQQQQQTPAGNNNSNASAQSLMNDDIMVVNGTPMTDEVSARILQSMAQKSFSNQQRYQQQQHQTKVAAMPPPPQQQQQQIVIQHTSPTSVLLSPKEYPLYSGNQLSAQQSNQHGSSVQQQQLSASPNISTQYTNPVQHQTSASATSTYMSASAANGGVVYPTMSTSGAANIGRQTHSAPSSRTHSLERNKSYEANTTITRKSAADYYKSNSNSSGAGARGHHHASTHGAHALSTSISNIPLDTQQQQQHSSAQIIHLQTLKTSLAATNATLANSSYTIATNSAASAVNTNANTDDEDIIGEEVRPTPVNTQDLRLRILHAVQQDHTYANAMPTHLSAAESAKGVGGAQAASSAVHMGKAGVTSNSTMLAGAASQSQLQSALAAGGSQQWSLGGIGATVAAAGQTGLGNMLPTPPSSGQSTYTLHGQQIPRMQQDDDAHSAISNGSRVATGDIDPGEETETAPEAEAEDDSVTRCICDLTHDDGYMICCDKCSVWQHVDCMGIDRQNIPDEYQCEVCQPRPVDKARARALQLMKRKEQTQLLLSAQSAHATGSTGAYLSGASGAGNLSGNYQLQDGQQRHLGGSNSNAFMLGSGADGNMHGLPNSTTLGTTKKGKVLKKTAKDAAAGKKSKKAEKLAALGGKPPRKDSGATKKTTKRKSKSSDGLSATATAAEKHAANLRQWIENYELAVTNHYSPELRARLHAITKQPSLLQSILNTENRALKECCNNGLENRATTVPHAGGKILISNMDIAPSCPIFELRGKYMLSPQYKTQNASVNMNSPPPSNFLAATLKAHKTPGPFIFFYQLPDAEAPMQTMNQDGSYPPLPPQPAYLKGPEICVDTRTYGNEARFVRRSCRPNAEIQHLFEKGTIHLFIVATMRIRASTEITIKHEPHDLLAIDNKKATASNCIVQPTSTACACGLLKDCLFGPPPTQQSLGASGATKSSSRKSSLATTLNGGVQLNSSAAAMQLTMGGLPAGSNKKKGAAQNINRNRSTSSSGDSSIGTTVAPGMNSPSVALPTAPLNMNASLSNSSYKSNGGLNILSAHALAASAAVPNSNGNMSATSSVSSVMHDSGICTSSSSPSVSIPSPTTLHMHSPTPQAQSQPQQQAQQQHSVPAAAGVQRSNSSTLFVQHSPQQQQQHQQILGALPTPLLLSPSQQLVQLPPQPSQQQVPATINNVSAPLLQEVTSAETTTPTALAPAGGSTQPQTNLLIQQSQEQLLHHSELAGPTISDASLAAAAALQSLNTAVTLTSSCAALAPSAAISNNSNVVVITPETITPRGVEASEAELQQQQQTQYFVATPMPPAQQDFVDGSMQAAAHQQQQQQQQPTQTLTTVELPPPTQTHVAIGAASPNAGPKSPQKHSNNTAHAAYVPPNTARSHKTPGTKSSSSRSTSFSEDDHQQQQHNTSSGSVNDDSTVVTPNSKDKPKLSREDRKMEAILRAIEKMERNQQRKNQNKSGGSASSGATKRRNSNSNSPTTPTKRSMGELSSSSGRVSAANARKKKRKAHKSYSGHSAQARKRRKSRMNSSNESVDDTGNSAGNANVHSEAESTSLLSPAAPLASTAPIYQHTQAEHSDTLATTNEDQAAGLLLAFANPNLKMSPTPQQSPQAVASPTAQQQQQYGAHYALEQLKSPQHRTATSGGNGASPPATPVSSACLLIEAAVGPLQEHMDGASPSGEFKYPNKTKTKKVLMSNWLLNQVDADTSGSDSPPPTAPTPPPPPATNNNGADALVPQSTPLPTGAMLGLDSLVQAATMCDYRKQHNEPDASYMPNDAHCGTPMSVDEPENLSMAAQKVEEFIQQTERGNSGIYNPTTIAAAGGTPRSLLHLPLQVSTCSNNSSVKKRWLRQAISEETTTDESMTPTPTAAAMSAGLQNASPTTASAAAHLNAVLNVPNGFTTPLKKRRLIISGDVKEEEDVGGSSVASPAAGVSNVFESPVIGLVKTEPTAAAPSAAEVDVMNVNVGAAPRACIKHEAETSDEEEVDEEEDDAEEERDDVDVVGGVGVHELQTSATTTIAHVADTCFKQEVTTKAERLLEAPQQLETAADELKPDAMLIDQDDDVDILRSPSPGHQQMLAAEDNLVKIEPEDTSGGDDVKIDVEREESLAGDKFEEMVLMQVKKEEAANEVAERSITTEAADGVKVNAAEDEKPIKSAPTEENALVADEKPYKQLFEDVAKVAQPKKEERTHTFTTSKPKVETSQALEPIYSTAVAPMNVQQRISTTPTKTSPLKLLTLDGSSMISSDEPLKKRLKLETSTVETSATTTEVQQTSLLKPLSARMHEISKQNDTNDIVPTTTAATAPPAALTKPTATLKVEHCTPNTPPTAAAQPNCMTFLAAAAAAAIERKPPPPPPVTTAAAPAPMSTQSTTTIGSVAANTNSVTSTAPAVNATNSEAGTVSVNNVATPLPNNGSVSTALAPRKQNAANNNNSNERKVPLTDDDIQACLHSFHKENILILQSRNNKKSKPNATTATAIGGSANELVAKSAKLTENKSSATTNYSSHHSHHSTHAHNDTAKSVSSSSKHSSASKSLTNSSSSGSSSTKKLHKKERNGKERSSSSSRSSSAHSSKLSSSSSKKVSSSSSHKKDHVSGKSSGSSTPVPSAKQQTHNSATSYNNSTNSNSASAGGDGKDRADERRERDNNRFDKERHHHRHRTTSSSSNASTAVSQSQTPAAANSTTPTPPPPISKKRQLNFEQELTKDLPLVNAVTSNSNRHRKDSGSRDSREDMLSSSCSSTSSSSLAARKRRESSSSSGGGSRHRHNSGGSCGAAEKDALAAHKSAVAEHNGILASAHISPLPPPTYVREHVAIPHFNNVVVSGPPPPLMAAYFSGIGAVPGGNMDASMSTPIATYVPTPAMPPTAGAASQPTHNHNLLKTLPMQPVLSHLSAAVHMQSTLPTLSSSNGGNVTVLPPSTATVAPPTMHSPGAAGGLLPGNSAGVNSAASTYNSIYGKLRDNPSAIVPPTLSAVTSALTGGPSVTPSGGVGKTTITAATASTSANISLSEYLDTKVKSYSTTLGGYVTPAHTYIGGTGTNSAAGKTTNNNTSSNSATAAESITAVATPLESPVANKLPTPLKLPLTRTASHDPRLNPQLNAPEPPPAPKRKLSINEYRKRMQLSTDSTTPSTPEPPAVSSTATTPTAHMTPTSLNNSFVQAYNSIVNASPEEMARQLSASPTTLTLNKYTLNSPERKRRHSGSDKEQRHSVSYDEVSGLLNSSTGSSSSCGNASDNSLTNVNHEDDGRKGQFSAAPTLLEKQQEKLCERLKLLRNMKKSVATLSSAASEFANLKKDCDLYVNRTNSISSTDNLDNCLEEISSSSSSSSSTSRASSREASPERSGVVSSSSSASICKRATSTTSSNHKWLHEPETTTTTATKSVNTNATRGDTPTRDDVLVAARCGSESAT